MRPSPLPAPTPFFSSTFIYFPFFFFSSLLKLGCFLPALRRFNPLPAEPRGGRTQSTSRKPQTERIPTITGTAHGHKSVSRRLCRTTPGRRHTAEGPGPALPRPSPPCAAGHIAPTHGPHFARQQRASSRPHVAALRTERERERGEKKKKRNNTRGLEEVKNQAS